MDVLVAAVDDQYPQDHHDVADRKKHEKSYSGVKRQVRLLLGRVNEEHEMILLVRNNHADRCKDRNKKTEPLMIHEILVVLPYTKRRIHSQ